MTKVRLGKLREQKVDSYLQVGITDSVLSTGLILIRGDFCGTSRTANWAICSIGRGHIEKRSDSLMVNAQSKLRFALFSSSFLMALSYTSYIGIL